MTPEQLLAFKEALIQACDNHIKNGGKVISGSFHRGETGMCPVSCLIGGLKETSNAFNTEMSEKLGFPVSGGEAWAFVDGFDGNMPRQDYKEVNTIGADLRSKYITKE